MRYGTTVEEGKSAWWLLIRLHLFYHGQAEICFHWVIHILYKDMTSLHVILLPTSSFMDCQNGLPIFITILLIFFFPQQRKSGNGLLLMELTCFDTY